jgi:hypothetical protein
VHHLAPAELVGPPPDAANDGDGGGKGEAKGKAKGGGTGKGEGKAKGQGKDTPPPPANDPAAYEALKLSGPARGV